MLLLYPEMVKFCLWIEHVLYSMTPCGRGCGFVHELDHFAYQSVVLSGAHFNPNRALLAVALTDFGADRLALDYAGDVATGQQIEDDDR